MASEWFCEPCQSEDLSSPAVKWCTECEEALCTDCERSHRKSKASKHHTLADLVSGKTLPKVKVQDCKLHDGGQKIDLFCIDHDELCCRICMTENHRSCSKVVPIDVAAKDVKSSAMLSHISEQAVNMTTYFEDTLKEITEEDRDIDRQEKEVTDQISSYKKHVIDCVEEAEKIIKSEIQQTCTQRRENLKQVQECMSEYKDQIESCTTSLQSLSESGSNEQLFLFAHRLKIILVESEKALEENHNLIKRETMSFTPNKGLISSENILGQINVATKVKDDLQLSLPRPGAQASGGITDSVSNSKISTVKKRLVFGSRFELLRSVGSHQIRGIAIMEDGNLLVCDHNSTCVLVYSSDGKYLDSCNVRRYPWNIAILEEASQAIVSLTGNLKLASVIAVCGHLQFIDLKTMTSIREIKLDFVPLAVNTIGNEIIIGTWNKVQYLDRHGTFKRDINLERSKYALTYLLAVNSDSNDTVYYSTSELHRIRKDGRKILCFNYISGRPRGICSDDQGFIYVATNSGQLLKFSPEGNLCDTLLHGNEGYGKLWAISFNQDYKKMYIATDNGKFLSVFELQ